METFIDEFQRDNPVSESLLRKMDAKRLLAYYKSWRTKYRNKPDLEDYWRQKNTPARIEHINSQIVKYDNYMALMKSILSTKEHVEKKKNK